MQAMSEFLTELFWHELGRSMARGGANVRRINEFERGLEGPDTRRALSVNVDGAGVLLGYAVVDNGRQVIEF
jgi:hypothetical protein